MAIKAAKGFDRDSDASSQCSELCASLRFSEDCRRRKGDRMVFAVAATLKKMITSGFNLQCAIQLFEASSSDEAVGKFIEWSSEKWPEHDVHVRPVWIKVEAPQETAEESQANTQQAHTVIALAKYSDYLRESGGKEDSQFVDWLARQQQ